MQSSSCARARSAIANAPTQQRISPRSTARACSVVDAPASRAELWIDSTTSTLSVAAVALLAAAGFHAVSYRCGTCAAPALGCALRARILKPTSLAAGASSRARARCTDDDAPPSALDTACKQHTTRRRMSACMPSLTLAAPHNAHQQNAFPHLQRQAGEHVPHTAYRWSHAAPPHLLQMEAASLSHCRFQERLASAAPAAARHRDLQGARSFPAGPVDRANNQMRPQSARWRWAPTCVPACDMQGRTAARLGQSRHTSQAR